MKTGTKASTTVGLLHWGLLAPVITTMLALGLALALSMPLALVIAPQPAVAAERPVEHFSRLPHFTEPELSPDGKWVAYITTVATDDDSAPVLLVAQNLELGQRNSLLSTDNTEARIRWHRWANNDRILVSVMFAASRYDVDTTETRLFSINVHDREDFISLYNPRNFRRPEGNLPQLQDKIVDILPNDPDHVLLALDIEEMTLPSVHRVNVYNGDRERIERHRLQIRDWMTDHQGRIRIGTSVNYDQGHTRIYHRAVGEDDWQLLFEFDMHEEPEIEAIAFAEDPNVLFYTAYNGDLKALYKINLSTGEKTPVHIDPNYDVQGHLLRVRDGGSIIGLQHWRLPGGITYWDENYTALQESIDRALPDYSNRLIDFSRDGNVYLLSSRNTTTPAAYYLGNRSEKSLDFLAEEYPELGAESLFRRRLVRYTTRDGMEIRAYLMTPGNIDGPLPAILFPPGDSLLGSALGSFDYWTAFFTDRGYAVLKPEFRGSAGYGLAFARARIQNWGLQMQDDLSDAARYMVEEGIAQQNKICIVGAGYGGYAAMMAAVKTPDLFTCGVSFAGISDLNRYISTSRHFLRANIIREEIGPGSRDRRARSPYNDVDAIQMPLLLAHGEDDRIVDVMHSRRMASRLESADKKVQYIELPEGNHSLDAQANRHEFFRTMDDFLKRHLGP